MLVTIMLGRLSHPMPVPFGQRDAEHQMTKVRILLTGLAGFLKLLSATQFPQHCSAHKTDAITEWEALEHSAHDALRETCALGIVDTDFNDGGLILPRCFERLADAVSNAGIILDRDVP